MSFVDQFAPWFAAAIVALLLILILWELDGLMWSAGQMLEVLKP